mmetsp:Transcript_111202/g.313834  ORF Transcript_111202/g.313834 Transcript_111202/m.313834 type:complete len:209 (-) Transcript_111202:1359-1985(-)
MLGPSRRRLANPSARLSPSRSEPGPHAMAPQTQRSAVPVSARAQLSSGSAAASVALPASPAAAIEERGRPPELVPVLSEVAKVVHSASRQSVFSATPRAALARQTMAWRAKDSTSHAGRGTRARPSWLGPFLSPHRDGGTPQPRWPAEAGAATGTSTSPRAPRLAARWMSCAAYTPLSSSEVSKSSQIQSISERPWRRYQNSSLGSEL